MLCVTAVYILQSSDNIPVAVPVVVLFVNVLTDIILFSSFPDIPLSAITIIV